MKLAIVGSVDLTGEQRDEACWLIDCVLRATAPDLVISGGADGIDSAAIDVADCLGMSWLVIPPDVKKWDPPGQRGFKARNIEIAEECNMLLRICSLQSKTYGSGWTADYAEKIGRKVRRYYV